MTTAKTTVCNYANSAVIAATNDGEQTMRCCQQASFRWLQSVFGNLLGLIHFPKQRGFCAGLKQSFSLSLTRACSALSLL